MADHIYHATVTWRRAEDADFGKGRYSRGHVWRFDGGIEVKAAASPLIVPRSLTPEDAVDPEEALVASLSSCHMLTFLDIARRAGFVIESYEDKAVGLLERNTAGHLWMSKLTLRPQIAWGGAPPSAEELDRLHHDAHDNCIVANSVMTEVRVQSTRSAVEGGGT
jgi:organic hydroperoxide reductase OsmC/OhrA